jgi:hypothetical protein
MKKEILKTIINNPSNYLFFKAGSFFEDKRYNVVYAKNGTFFRVQHAHGTAYYKLDKTTIGRHTQLTDIEL